MSFDLDIAARTLWCEARGEIEIGQRAVAAVLVNRMKNGRWGSSLSSVCLWPWQFSSWNTQDSNRKAMSFLSETDPLLLKLSGYIQDALSGAQDVTNGATHYYATWISPPIWVTGATFCGQFGKQMFYKDVH
jgi:N-acetylmuramoyl-L-alanine amidase